MRRELIVMGMAIVGGAAIICLDNKLRERRSVWELGVMSELLCDAEKTIETGKTLKWWRRK